jgi:hypothetical protein
MRITLRLSIFQMPEIVDTLSYETRRARVVSSLEFVVDYDYDTEQELWCKIQLAVSTCLLHNSVKSLYNQCVLPLHVCSQK